MERITAIRQVRTRLLVINTPLGLPYACHPLPGLQQLPVQPPIPAQVKHIHPGRADHDVVGDAGGCAPRQQRAK